MIAHPAEGTFISDTVPRLRIDRTIPSNTGTNVSQLAARIRTEGGYVDSRNEVMFADAVVGPRGPIGPTGSLGATSMLPMSVPGDLGVGVGQQPFLATRALTIIGCRAACGVAPFGGDIIFDVNVNGESVFTDQSHRPRILDGSKVGPEVVPAITAIPDGALLTVDIDQTGSPGTSGSDATLIVEVI